MRTVPVFLLLILAVGLGMVWNLIIAGFLGYGIHYFFGFHLLSSIIWTFIVIFIMRLAV
jgi:hypothetical protein